MLCKPSVRKFHHLYIASNRFFVCYGINFEEEQTMKLRQIRILSKKGRLRKSGCGSKSSLRQPSAMGDPIAHRAEASPLLASAFALTQTGSSPMRACERVRARPQEQPAGTAWVDSIPGLLCKLLRRFGLLFGVYVAIAGAGFTFLGGLARILVRNMFSNTMTGFGADPFSGGGTIWYDEAGNVLSGPFGSSISSMATNNPVYTMGTVIMVLGIVLLITGIVLAIYLKRRFNRE